MTLRNERELTNTREKLGMLEADYDAVKNDPDEDEELREITQESLTRLINQLKEEIARYECRQPVRR